MFAMFGGSSTLSIANYDAILIGWSSLPTLQSDVPLGANSISYCTAEAARQSLIDDYGWTITDAGLDCPDFTVQFLDHDTTLIDTQSISSGDDATAPADPTRTGYTFTGWSPSDLTNITADTDFTAQYTINQYTLTFDSAG